MRSIEDVEYPLTPDIEGFKGRRFMTGCLRYEGNGVLEDATAWINQALKKNNEMLHSQGLTGDLQEYQKDLNIIIRDSSTHYRMALDPTSGEGHDFSITFNKKTMQIEDMVVGSILPDPEEEEG